MEKMKMQELFNKRLLRLYENSRWAKEKRDEFADKKYKIEVEGKSQDDDDLKNIKFSHHNYHRCYSIWINAYCEVAELFKELFDETIEDYRNKQLIGEK